MQYIERECKRRLMFYKGTPPATLMQHLPAGVRAYHVIEKLTAFPADWVLQVDDNETLLSIPILENLSTHLALSLNARCAEAASDIHSQICVLALYRWQTSEPENIRNNAMAEHFQLEKRTQWFDSFDFGITTQPAAIDFVFTGRAKTNAQLDAMYADPALQQMRILADRFLDESTRQAALFQIIGAA